MDQHRSDKSSTNKEWCGHEHEVKCWTLWSGSVDKRCALKERDQMTTVTTKSYEETRTSRIKTDEAFRVELIKQAGELITTGIESWVEAGTIIASILDAAPDSIGMITSSTGLDEHIIQRFYSLGKREIHPLMLCSTAPGVKKLALCPYNQQEKYINEPVNLVLRNGEALRVNVKELTTDQVRQVFANGHVRTDSEQRAWLESERARADQIMAEKKSDAQPLGYTIRGKTVIFTRGLSLSERELKDILLRM